MARSGAVVVLDRAAQVAAGINLLATTRLMVGVPADRSSRSDGVSNADLAYIHNNGAPEVGIPPRPHLEPGIRRVQGQTVEGLRRAAQLALEGRPDAVERQLNVIGLRAVSSIRQVIVEDIPPPLKYATVMGRIRRRASKSWRAERRAAVRANVEAGAAPGAGLFTALLDTGAYMRSISYVIRKVLRA